MNYNLDTDDSLLGDSIIAGFLRYPNIWYKFFDENTIYLNCGVIPLPQYRWSTL